MCPSSRGRVISRTKRCIATSTTLDWVSLCPDSKNIMRQSIASHRASQPAPSLPTSGAAIGRLHEKMKEFEAVSALEQSSGLFLRRIESLGEDCDVMAESGQGNLYRSRLKSLLNSGSTSPWANSVSMVNYVPHSELVLCVQFLHTQSLQLY